MAEIKNYAILNSEGIVLNVISYDGTSDYNPGTGLHLIQSDTAEKGDIYDFETGEFLKDTQLNSISE